MENVVAIIPAAGSGKRMQKGVNKQFLEIGGQTVIERTLGAFQNADRVNRVIVVTKKEEIESVKAIAQTCGFTKVKSIVQGGTERQDSIYQGLKETTDQDRWILVHDGARPFITSAGINEMVENLVSRNRDKSVYDTESLILAVPSKDTIKRVKDQCVTDTLNRAELWNVQTPQGFSREVLIQAYEQAKDKGFKGTDDASLVEWAGHKVFVHVGSYENIKITTPDDLYLGEAILKKRGAL